jgi:hypothetical protein
MAQADELAEATADHSVATWLAAETRTDPRAQAGDLSMSRALERRWLRVSEAIADGAVNLAQALVIVAALEDLPANEVGSEVMARAEQALLAYADTYGPRQLRRLGRRILEVAAPDTCEEQEGKALEREERRAAAVTSLSLRRIGGGTTRLTGRPGRGPATHLRGRLHLTTSTFRHDGSGRGRANDSAASAGEAFSAFLENVDPRRMPLHGGDATTVLVTMDLETLTSKLRGRGLVGEEPISAAQARRMACTAQIIPVVLGGGSQVLDVGRSRRLFTPAQRKAMAVRDRCCRTEGCLIPAAWCEAHHAARPWQMGGRTDLADGALLCSWHHHRAHDPGYTTRRLPNGDFRFHRRT